MVTIKNVAAVGASGALGDVVLKTLIDSGKFNVTVLVRSNSKTTFPSSVKAVTVDYADVEALTKALHGQDAVVSTVGTLGLQGQNVIIDAAVAAGVKRFIPSEFGADLDNPKTAKLPVFAYKVQIANYAEEKATANPNFSYTLIRNGAFLDWGLEKDFLIDLKSDKPTIFDGGDQLTSVTTLKSVAQAVLGVLEHLDETKNRAVYVKDTVVSQNKLLALARKIAPERKWVPVLVSLADVERASNEALGKGQVTPQVMVGYLYVALFGKGYGGNVEKTDNELLGVAGDKTDDDIEAILRPLLK